MKQLKNTLLKKYFLFIFFVPILFASCMKDLLDKKPLSNVTADQYLTNEVNLSSYAIDLYNMLPTHGEYGWGTFELDNNTDNMAGMQPSAMYAPGQWRVQQTGGDWEFTNIFRCNYFLQHVVPSFESNNISGNPSAIRHYIGEVYFFRAYSYFQKLQSVGDFPILRETLPDEKDVLIAASKRSPRNEVARFILDDLDKAIELLNESAPSGGKNRLSKNVAYLFKSRVALYEGTWLKYFKGTAFVPKGTGWPGNEKDYNENYEYPLGNIDSEIDFFLAEAMEASKIVANQVTLVNNTGNFQSNPTDPPNPYFNMFGDTDMENYSEVLLWRRYSSGVGIMNNVGMYETRGNNGIGTTRSMVDAFIMKDGKPIYASPKWVDENSSYWGDNNLEHITKNRDSRADLFIKKPGQRNLHTARGSHGVEYESGPDITATSGEEKYTTGYAIRKGLSFDGKNTDFAQSTIGSIVFRASEAYLNYIEACYERNGSLDSYADIFWRKLRERAKINENYNYTIDLTDMSIEGETDWGAYSAGALINPTLYNIRRERRCELMAEGLRMMDIKRWRALDQMISTPYFVEGFNLWDEMYNWGWYKDNNGNSVLEEGVNVSSRTLSKYLQPYRILPNNIAYNGYRWKLAHYLSPISVQHFINTSDGSLEASPIYQNPGWPLQAGGVPN